MVILNTLVKTHYIRNNLLAFVSIIVVSISLSQNISMASGDWYWLPGLLAFIPANIAYSKGRNYFKWYIYAVLFWLISFIHSLCISANDTVKLRKGYHICPYCGELSRPEATICHCCGHNLYYSSN